MKATDPEVLHLQHLHWALEFFQTSLVFRGGYLEDIKTKIYKFITDSNLQAPQRETRGILPEARSYVGELSDGQVEQIQQIFKEGFSEISKQSFIANTPEEQSRTTFYVGAINPLSHFFQSIWIQSDPVAQSAVALQSHLVRSGLTGEQVRICPECSKIFIRERKPQKGKEQFCSPACTRRAAKRAWVEREKASQIKENGRLQKLSPSTQPSEKPTPAARPAKKKSTKVKKR